MKKLIATAAFAAAMVLFPGHAYCQKTVISTNFVGYAHLLTMNAEASYAVARHISLTGGIAYNPWEFRGGMDGYDYRDKQLSLSVGARYWPWHIFSGWWVASKAQYQMYNTGGRNSLQTSEGDRYGIGASLGYTYLLGKHFNVEVGLGLWGGLDVFKTYSCPVCGLTIDSGRKMFARANDIILAVSYVF